MLTNAPTPRRSVEFVVKGEPATKARARVTFQHGKPRAYTPEATRRAEAQMRAAFVAAVGRVAPSGTHGFGVEAAFYLHSGIRRDVDNMLKIVLDGLNKIAWADDHQVVEVIGRKRSAPKGEERTEVRVYVLGQLESRQSRCERCGETFPRPPSHAAKKYCSQVCRSAALAERRQRTCPRCGDTFQSHHVETTPQKYCSPECAQAATRVELECAACGRAVTRARSTRGNAYCSPECKATYWRNRRKSAAKGTCQDCGGPTTKKTYKRCRDCTYAAGGRWADRDPDRVKCSTCGAFTGDAGCSRCP